MEKRECRYCLSQGTLDQFITPCSCQGSMKFVHQQCLSDWIKNSNKTIQETIKDRQKMYSFTCEICKHEMRYTKTFKNNFFISMTKLFKSIFSNLRTTCLLGIHSFVMYFIFKRFTMILIGLPKLFMKRRKPSFWMNLFHNFTVCFSIMLAIDDIFKFYKNIYIRKRKCVIRFLTKAD